MRKPPKIPEDLIECILRAMAGSLPLGCLDTDDMRKEAVRIVRAIRRYDVAKQKRSRG